MNHSPETQDALPRPHDRSLRWPMAASALWAAAIFAVSSVPGSNVPGRFGYLAHFVEYGVLGALLAVGLGRRRDPVGRALVAIALASAYAVTDEIHQFFVPGRSTDPLDWLADTAGALVAVAIVSSVTAWRHRRRPDQ